MTATADLSKVTGDYNLCSYNGLFGTVFSMSFVLSNKPTVFTPTAAPTPAGLSAGAIAGIAVGCAAFVGGTVFAGYYAVVHTTLLDNTPLKNSLFAKKTQVTVGGLIEFERICEKLIKELL